MTASPGRQDEPRSASPDRLRDSVVRFDGRRRKWATEAARVLSGAVAVAGIGWLIVIPAVIGFVLGHSLDSLHSTGIMFAAGLGLLGLVFGCWSAWRQVSRQR